MKKVTLYTKENCSLCDKVKTQLDALQASYPHQLELVDITQDSGLFEKYRYAIPVLKKGDQVLQAPIEPENLPEFLAG